MSEGLAPSKVQPPGAADVAAEVMSDAMPDVIADVMHDDWPALSQLLDEALALELPERGGWLASLPGTPAKAALARLLAQQAHVESANFLGALPRLSAAALANFGSEVATLAPKPGDEVGPWRLLSELGQGGMGAVWLAERSDGQLKRAVALKLPNQSWDAGLAERMLRERDILATLTHPNIARLYDAGFDALGRPFLALEHVDGRPIDEHVRGATFDVRAILALLLQVCAAVAHAHGRLVIHRDLKPANILVDAQGQVRLLDFGIAKLMRGEQAADTVLTRVAGRAFTPAYASPEQIRGEPLGTASDVYSLAVVAYELLTGSRPYRLDADTPGALEEAIARIDPPRASTAALSAAASRALRGDLDAILNKALKKPPEERYATVTALAEDLQRHLDGHAVLARPDSRWYIARKFVRRNRVPVVAAATIVAALGIGLGAALWQTATARENLKRATLALERETGGRRLAVETLAALAAVDEKARSAPDSVSRTLLAKLAELEHVVRNEPWQRISMLNAVATQLPYFGDYEGSLAVWRRYMPLVRAQRGNAHDLLEGYIGMAAALAGLQRPAETEAVAREGLAETASATGAAGPRGELAYELAGALIRRGVRDEAKELLAEHIAAIEASERPEARTHKARHDLTMLRAHIELDHDPGASLRFAQQARAGYASIADSSLTQLAVSAINVGLAQAAIGRLAEAEDAFKSALETYRRVFSREDRYTVQAVGRVAAVVAAQGRYAEALQLLAEVQRDVEIRPGQDTAAARRIVLTRQLELALMHGDLERAAGLIEPLRAASGAAPRDRGAAAMHEARWHLLSGRPKAAQELLAAWSAQWPKALPAEPLLFRASLLEAEAESELGALGVSGASGASVHFARARSLVDEAARELRRMGATRNWDFKTALEMTAMLDAEMAPSGAGAAFAALEREEIALDLSPLQSPSRVAAAESLQRRSRLLRAAGRTADAAALEPSLRAALQGQHPASPRRAWLAGTPP